MSYRPTFQKVSKRGPCCLQFPSARPPGLSHTDTLQDVYASSPLQRLLQSHPEHCVKLRQLPVPLRTEDRTLLNPVYRAPLAARAE
jgi:hypothetical protein